MVISDRARGAVAERLQGPVERLASRRRIPHAILGVSSGDGSFTWIGAAGPARPDGAAMGPQTPFFIASVTKLYIATVILQLCERGEVALDAPMASYLPAELVSGLHSMDGVDHTPRISVRHLLSHTSGLPDFLEDRPKGGRSWYRQIADGADRSWTVQEAVRHVRGELQPHFPPRDLTAARVKARYSDTGFQLLIAIAEAITGRPFQEVLEQRLFSPLDLRHTWLPGHSHPLEPTPEPAGLWSEGRPLDIPLAMSASMDLMSTADDTLRFHRALARGEVFDDPATYRLMHERWNRIFYPMRYGLGTMRYDIPRLFGPGRRHVTLIGHSGSTGSWLFHCPELDVHLTGTVDEMSARTVPFRFFPKVLRTLLA